MNNESGAVLINDRQDCLDLPKGNWKRISSESARQEWQMDGESGTVSIRFDDKNSE
jgi:hypothetical protein